MSVNATVLNFDDIPLGTSTGLELIDNAQNINYGGFTWGPFWYVANTQVHANYLNAATSGTQFLLNGFGTSNLSIQRASSFTFDGAWFKTPNQENASDWVKITAYDAFEQLIGSTGNIAVSTNALWVGPGFKNVSRLTIEQSGGWFTMDDFTFDTVTSTIPEPASLTLIGLTLIGLVVSRKQKSTY